MKSRGLICAISLLLLVLGPLACGSNTKDESTTPEEFLKKEKGKQGDKGKTQKSTDKGSAAAAGDQGKTAATAPEAGEPEADETAPIPSTEVQNALQFVRSGKYEQAISQTKAALKRNEKYVPAMVVMARAHYHLGKTEFADSICDIALSIDANSGECYNLKGFVALKNENDTLALKYFEKATQVRPSFGPPWLNLGVQYLKVKNYNAAIPALEKAMELMSKRPEVYLNLGSAYRGAGDVSKAQQSYKEALKLRSNFPDVNFNLGILFLDAPSFPGMSKLDQLNTAVSYFNTYKRQKTYLSKDDPVDSYIKEAQKAYEREQKAIQREAQRKAREAAKKAPPSTPAPAPAPAPAGAKPSGTK